MSTLTSWGYSLSGETALADIITETEFNTMTAGRYTGDSRISPGITIASLALRNFCGWHLTGSYDCELKWTVTNRGIVRRGSDMIIQLPARFVSAIIEVKIAGEVTTDYTFQTNGLLTVYDVNTSNRRDLVEIKYTAGTTTASALKDLVVQMVTLSIVKSPGVTSEAAGGVSVTYNSAWTNGSFDAILANNAGMLAPYRLEGVF